MMDGGANYSFETESTEEVVTADDDNETTDSYVFIQVRTTLTISIWLFINLTNLPTSFIIFLRV